MPGERGEKKPVSDAEKTFDGGKDRKEFLLWHTKLKFFSEMVRLAASPPEITIREVPDSTPYSPRSGFLTSSGSSCQTNYFRFSTRWEAEEFARSYGRY